MKLREVGVGSLHCRIRQANAKQSRVALVRDRPHQDSAQPEEASFGQGLHNLAGLPFGAGQVGFAHQRRDQFSPGASVGLQMFEVFDAFGDFGIVDGTDIEPLLGCAGGRVKVPVAPSPALLRDEAPFR